MKKYNSQDIARSMALHFIRQIAVNEIKRKPNGRDLERLSEVNLNLTKQTEVLCKNRRESESLAGK